MILVDCSRRKNRARKRGAGRRRFLPGPPLPYKCGVPFPGGTPHLCGSEEFCPPPKRCRSAGPPRPASFLYSPPLSSKKWDSHRPSSPRGFWHVNCIPARHGGECAGFSRPQSRKEKKRKLGITTKQLDKRTCGLSGL